MAACCFRSSPRFASGGCAKLSDSSALEQPRAITPAFQKSSAEALAHLILLAAAKFTGLRVTKVWGTLPAVLQAGTSQGTFLGLLVN